MLGLLFLRALRVSVVSPELSGFGLLDGGGLSAASRATGASLPRVPGNPFRQFVLELLLEDAVEVAGVLDLNNRPILSDLPHRLERV